MKFDIKADLGFVKATVTLRCAKCGADEFDVLNDPFFVCKCCGEYYNDLDQLVNEGDGDLERQLKEAEDELVQAIKERFGKL